MGRLKTVLLLVLGAALAPAAAAGQQSCAYRAEGDQNIVGLGTPNEIHYVGGGVQLDCAGGTRILADSIVIHVAMGLADLIGNVSFADTAKTLTATTARYYSRDRQLAAQGSEGRPVILTDLATGSVIRAPNLNYFQNDERIEIYSGRPVATLYRTAAAERAPGDTTVVTSDAMTIRGDQAFEGRGNVVIQRAGMDATAQQRAFFNEEAGILRLIGSAVAVLDSATLRGDSILAYTEAAPPREGSMAEGRASRGVLRLPGSLVPDSATEVDSAAVVLEEPPAEAGDTVPADPAAFREVLALGAATLETRDITADGARIVVLFQAGEVERLRVIGVPREAGGSGDPDAAGVSGDPANPASRAGAADAAELPQALDAAAAVAAGRAVARSESFVMVADSIEAVAPGQSLREVVAVGGARGIMRDTLAADTVGVPEIARSNWIEGDTIRAFFTAAAPDAGDVAAERDPTAVEVLDELKELPGEPGEEGGERVVERLEAVGAPARSLFRQREEGADPASPWDLSYLLAQRIVVRMTNGEVATVDAEGEVQGFWLTPDAAAGRGRGGVGR